MGYSPPIDGRVKSHHRRSHRSKSYAPEEEADIHPGLSLEHGAEKVRDIIVHDIRQSQLSGDKENVLILLHVLHPCLAVTEGR